MIDPRDYSQSLREPQLTPADHCYTVLQDHGPNGGGWGPAAVSLPWQPQPQPFVYTGSDPNVIAETRDGVFTTYSCPATQLEAYAGSLVMWRRSGYPVRIPFAWVYALSFREIDS